MAGGDPLDPLEIALPELARRIGQESQDGIFVARTADADRMQPLGHACESNKVTAAMPEQRTLSERGASEQEPLLVPIKPGECEITQKPSEGTLAPPFECGGEKIRIRKSACIASGDAERRRELVTIVEANVGHEREAAASGENRLAVEIILRKHSEQIAAESDRPVQNAVTAVRAVAA